MMRARASLLSNGGTSLCSFSSSVAHSTGITDAWLETICPTLT